MTKLGRWALVWALVALVAGRLTELRELIAVAAALGGALAVGALWGRVPRGVTIDRQVLTTSVPVGAAIMCRAEVRGAGARLPAGLVLREPFAGQARELPVTGPSLTYRVPTTRRGLFQLGPVTLSREEPFGLFRRGVEVAAAVDVWVRPTIHPLAGGRRGRRDDAASERGGAAAAGEAFVSLRPYVVGDDLRRVHWAASAHAGQLVVREYADVRVVELVVVLDTLADHYPRGADQFEQAVEVAASLVADTEQSATPVRLHTTDPAITRLTGIPSRDLLAAVARTRPDHTGPLLGAILEVRGDQRAVVVSGRPADGAVEALTRATRAAFALVLVDEAIRAGASEPAGVGVLRVSSAEEFAHRWSGWSAS